MQGYEKESVFLSKSDLGSNFGIVQGCLSFIAMHLQVKKKNKTIIMEIPARDEDGAGRLNSFVVMILKCAVPSFSVNIKLLFNCTF